MSQVPMSIASNWELFERRVISPSAPAVQRHEMKMAFYVGVQAMLFLQLELAELPEQHAVGVLKQLYGESESFFKMFATPTTTAN